MHTVIFVSDVHLNAKIWSVPNTSYGWQRGRWANHNNIMIPPAYSTSQSRDLSLKSRRLLVVPYGLNTWTMSHMRRVWDRSPTLAIQYDIYFHYYHRNSEADFISHFHLLYWRNHCEFLFCWHLHVISPTCLAQTVSSRCWFGFNIWKIWHCSVQPVRMRTFNLGVCVCEFSLCMFFFRGRGGGLKGCVPNMRTKFPPDTVMALE